MTKVNSKLNIECILGGPQTGKTTKLIELANEAASKGEKVLFVCANANSLIPFQKRFSEQVRVVNPATPALEVMHTDEADELFGRGESPHDLSVVAQQMLDEDMKVSQFKNKRLYSVLNYLYAGWSNLSDDTWEQTYEEDMLIERLHANLRFIGGILPCELSNLALNVLRQCEYLVLDFGVDHVFIDDFCLLSRATQHFLCKLARLSITIAANTHEQVALACEKYPNFNGVSELCEAFENVQVKHLEHSYQAQSVTKALGVLDNASGAGAFEVLSKPTIEQELQALATIANDALERNETVAIVGTNGLWRRNVIQNLRRVGFNIEVFEKPERRIKNLLDVSECHDARQQAITALNWDFTCGVTWRVLLGLGDGVARSCAIDRLRCTVNSKDSAIEYSLPAALRMLYNGEIKTVELDEPLYDDLMRVYGHVWDVLGMEENPEEMDEQNFRGNPYVKCMLYAKAKLETLGDRQKPAVLVCAPEQLAGRHVDNVLFGGFVAGLIPCRDYFDPAGLAGAAKQREWQRACNVVYSACAAATKNVTFTAFETCSLEVAETMGVHIERIKLKNGVRMARTCVWDGQ